MVEREIIIDYLIKNHLAVIAIILALFAAIPTWYQILKNKVKIDVYSDYRYEARSKGSKFIYFRVYNSGEKPFKIQSFIMKAFFKKEKALILPFSFFGKPDQELEPGQSEDLFLPLGKDIESLLKKKYKFYVCLNNGKEFKIKIKGKLK